MMFNFEVLLLIVSANNSTQMLYYCSKSYPTAAFEQTSKDINSYIYLLWKNCVKFYFYGKHII